MSSPDEELNQQIQNKFIRDTVRPFESKSRIQFEEDKIPTYKVEKSEPIIEHMFQPPIQNFTPINDNLVFSEPNVSTPHNCVHIFESVRKCPICKHLYSKNDGIYISVIIILIIVIIILLKIVFQKK